MAQTDIAETAVYYEEVRRNGLLLTAQDAHQWSHGVLRALGFALPRGVRKDLARALPEELAKPLSRKFWLLHFHDKDKPVGEFLKEIALTSGNTDRAFAVHPTTAVFHELKAMAGPELSDDVAEALAPEIADLWRRA
jgi:uncharacterized protein (DUF2267 family)